MKPRPKPSGRDVRNALRMYAAAAPDRNKAEQANLDLGLDKPERRKPSPDASKRPATRAPGASEAQVLNAVLGLLRRHPAVAWCHRLNVAAFEADDRYIRCGWVGASDIIGQMKDGRFLAIEVKRERGGVVSEAQQAFIDLVRHHGGVSGVVRSADEAALLIKYAVMRV